MPTIPDAIDVINALEDIAAGLCLDPAMVDDRDCWVCVVVNVISGEQISAAVGLTRAEAAASAWVACLPVEQLLDAILGRRPPPMPDGRWRFELAPPGCWERVHATVAPRVIGRG